MPMNTKTVLIAFAACIAAAGCSPLGPQPDHSKFFILTPLTDGSSATATPASTSAPLTIGIGPIDFPDYLRRLEVVTRSSPTQLNLSAEKRWGEPLDKNFERVLGENLAQLLNTRQIEKYPWSHKTQVDYQVSIDVQRFETSTDGQSQLVARWMIKDGDTGKNLSAAETTASAPVGNGETGASVALSTDLATLSREIAARIADLSQHRAPATSAIAPPYWLAFRIPAISPNSAESIAN
jgi:uncharacterized protein